MSFFASLLDVVSKMWKSKLPLDLLAKPSGCPQKVSSQKVTLFYLSPLVRGVAPGISSDRELEKQRNSNLPSPGCWQKTVDTVRHFYLLQAYLCTYLTSVCMYILYKRTHVHTLQVRVYVRYKRT